MNIDMKDSLIILFKKYVIYCLLLISFVFPLKCYTQYSYARDYKQAGRAVVKITATLPNGHEETGSGVFMETYEGSLLIVTAYHVIRLAKIEVEFRDFPTEKFNAEFVKADEDLDIAVIKVNYPPISLRDEILPFKIKPLTSGDEIKDNSKIIYKDVEQADIKLYQLKSTKGALIIATPPNHIRDMRVGDLIIQVNNHQISSEKNLTDYLSSLTINSEVNYIILRKSKRIVIKSKKSQQTNNSVKSLVSIGHPVGHKWIWRWGWLCHYSPETMKITKSLVERGISGGPLLDDKNNLTGIIIKKDEKFGYAVNILAIQKFLEKWKLPQSPWLSPDFCDKVQTLLKYREKEYSADDLMADYGKKSDQSIYEWEWDSKIKFSNHYENKIYKRTDELGKKLLCIYILTGRVHEGSDESDRVINDIADILVNCIDRSHVSSGSEVQNNGYYDYKTISYNVKGKWNPRYIDIRNWGYQIEIRFEVTR